MLHSGTQVGKLRKWMILAMIWVSRSDKWDFKRGKLGAGEAILEFQNLPARDLFSW